MPKISIKLTDKEIFEHLSTSWRYDVKIVRAFRNYCGILDKVEAAFCQLHGLKEPEFLPASMQRLLKRRIQLREALTVVNGSAARDYEAVAGLVTNFPSASALP